MLTHTDTHRVKSERLSVFFIKKQILTGYSLRGYLICWIKTNTHRMKSERLYGFFIKTDTYSIHSERLLNLLDKNGYAQDVVGEAI